MTKKMTLIITYVFVFIGVVNAVSVNVTSQEASTSTYTLIPLKEYTMTVSGYYIYLPSNNGIPASEADARFHNVGGTGWQVNTDLYFLEYRFEGDLLWLPVTNYTESDLTNHTYKFTIWGSGKRIQFHIYDDYYDDNWGHLSVTWDEPVLMDISVPGIDSETQPQNEPNTVSPQTTAPSTGNTDPIHLQTGEFVFTANDFSLKGSRISFPVTRYYRSNSEYFSPYGFGWDMSFNIRVQELSDNTLCYLNGRNQKTVYSLDAGHYVNESDPGNYFIEVSNAFVYYRKDGTQYRFDLNGCIEKIIDRFGNSVNFEYERDGGSVNVLKDLYGSGCYCYTPRRYTYPSDEGVCGAEVLISQYYQLKRLTIETITGVIERELLFVYRSDGFLNSITDTGDPNPAVTSDDRTWSYTISVYSNELMTVSTPYEIVDQDGIDSSAQLIYSYFYDFTEEQIGTDYYPRQRKLVRIYDPQNWRLLDGDPTYAYEVPYIEISYDDDPASDTFGRALYQTYGEGDGVHGNGVNEFVLDYNPADRPADMPAGSTVKVTDRKGQESFFAFTDKGADEKSVTKTPVNPAQRWRGEDDPASYDGPTYEYTTTEDGIEGEIKKITYPKLNSVSYTYYTATDGDKIQGNVKTVTTEPIPGSAEEGISLTTEFEYESSFGFIHKITDPRGNETTFTYGHEDTAKYGVNNSGNLMKITYPAAPTASDVPGWQVTNQSAIVEFTYYDDPVSDRDKFGLLKTVKNVDGITIKNEYYDSTAPIGSKGRLYRVTVDSYPDIETLFDYDEYGNVSKISHKDNNEAPGGYRVQEFDYNKLEQLIKTVSELGFETHYRYNLNKKLSKTEAQIGTTAQVTRYYYDLLDQLEQVEDSLGRLTTLNYDHNDNLYSVIDAKASVEPGSNVEDSKTIYDERNLPWITEDAKKAQTKHWYDENGNLKSIVDAKNQETIYEYDGFDRLKTIIYPLDLNGNLTTEAYEYDFYGNMMSRKTRNDDYIYYAHDVLGRTTGKAVLDARTTVTVMQDNALLGTSHSVNWGEFSDYHSTTSSDAFEYHCPLPETGNYMVQMIWPQLENATHDATILIKDSTVSGDVLLDTISLNQAVYSNRWNVLGAYTFNGSAKVVIQPGTGGQVTITDAIRFIPCTLYYYDKAGRSFEIIDAAGNHVSYRYDSLGRLESVTDESSKTIEYRQDDQGRWNKVYYPDHSGTNDSYVQYKTDAMGRLQFVCWNNEAFPLARYEYDELSRRTWVFYDYNRDGNDDASSEYDYEDAGAGDDDLSDNLEAVINRINGNTVVTSFEYTYDDAGNRLTMTGQPAQTHTYDYDDVYRMLKDAYSADLEESFNYDPLGNRLSRIFDFITTTYDSQYNELNQYNQVDADTLTYDKNGNLTSAGMFLSLDEHCYSYDAENRLTNVFIDQNSNYIYDAYDVAVASYTYDSLGRRATKHINANDTTTRYIYNGFQVIAEYENSGGGSELVRKYIYGPGIDEPIAMIAVDGGVETWYFYHFDGLGSVVALSKLNAGTVEIIERYRYDAFGQTIVCDAGGNPRSLNVSVYGNPYMFTGREYDPETELYYYRARMYSPELGRFCQPDPIGYADAMNLYQYCGNNPLNWTDPSGLFHFGKRPLDDGQAAWIPVLSNCPFSVYNLLNIEVSHEHGFFDDAQGGNIGFSPEGIFSEDPAGRNYRFAEQYYDDEIMRQAVQNVNRSGVFQPQYYHVLGIGINSNCQDYCRALRKEYKRLGGKVYKNKEEYLKENRKKQLKKGDKK